MNIQPLLAVLVLSGALAGCGLGSSDVSPRLGQAVRAVRHMTAPRQIFEDQMSQGAGYY
jgi:hypothetical protein